MSSAPENANEGDGCFFCICSDGIQAIDGLGELTGFDQTQRTAHLPLLRLLSGFRSRETPREALARLRAGARRGLGLAALGSGRGAALRIGLRRGVIVGRGRGSRRRGGPRRRGAAAAGADSHLADRGKGTGTSRGTGHHMRPGHMERLRDFAHVRERIREDVIDRYGIDSYKSSSPFGG